ncbi:hypothetical protein [Aeromonas eucrenophila]|uniref:Uncharacterized protein n=1 Tax=Aeromonas eucrenophila TaxID=649 RepID=A0ABW0YDV0_9GAMM|nr:hypothetical protein [Aeromonas eucrenophila]
MQESLFIEGGADEAERHEAATPITIKSTPILTIILISLHWEESRASHAGVKGV